MHELCVHVLQGVSASTLTFTHSCVHISQSEQLYVAHEYLHGIPLSLFSVVDLLFLFPGKMGSGGRHISFTIPSPAPLCRESLPPFSHDNKQ